MKRFLLWFFGIIIPLQFTLFFCLGKYLFFKETKVIFPKAESVMLVTHAIYSHHPWYELEITTTHNKYTISVTKEQGECYRKNGYCIDKWYKMHLWLFIIYWIIIGLVSIHNIVVLMKMCCAYEEENEIGTRFRTCRTACTNCANRCDFYNKLDSYDATPIKNKFWKFWGYKKK
jgi:hypothetical protein